MLIDRFLATGREFLGCKYPIMCGAMTWVSDPKLVSAVGNCGGFGLIAGGNAPVEVLKRPNYGDPSNDRPSVRCQYHHACTGL